MSRLGQLENFTSIFYVIYLFIFIFPDCLFKVSFYLLNYIYIYIYFNKDQKKLAFNLLAFMTDSSFQISSSFISGFSSSKNLSGFNCHNRFYQVNNVSSPFNNQNLYYSWSYLLGYWLQCSFYMKDLHALCSSKGVFLVLHGASGLSKELIKVHT